MFVLSAATAGELQRLIGETPGSGFGGQGGSASRQIAFVKVVTWNTTGPTANTGTCVVTEYNASSSTWTDFGTSSATVLLSAQSIALEVGKRYLAVRYGVTSYPPKTVFVAFPSTILPYYYAGCGVKLEGGKISVDLDNIKGQGLKVFPGTGEDCPKIGIDPGCHVTLEGGAKVGVTVDGMAGCGLKVETGTCNKLAFDAEAVGIEGIKGVGCTLSLNYGCGLDLEPDPLSPGDERIKVYAPDLAGDGLYPGAGCTLNVYPGCGIKIEADKVAVDLNNIKGQGLKVFSGSPCPKIGIDPGCHVSLEGGEKVGVLVDGMAGCGLTTEAVGGCSRLRIKTTPSSAYSFSAITSVSLIPQAYGCGFTFTAAVTPFELITNDCGVVVGFEAGTPFVTSSNVALPIANCTALCDYCDPPPDPWWCVSGSCVQAATAPVGWTAGPFGSSSACSAVCYPPSDPWWCVSGACVQAPTAPIGSTGGPFSSSVDCSAVCYPPPTPCVGECLWTWGESGWTMFFTSCGYGCECVIPPFPGLPGDSAVTTCVFAYTKPIGKCWDGTAWVVCEVATVLALMEPPTI